MLRQTREICREGVHGQAGQLVTKQDILEMVETYVPGSASVTIFPHNMAFSGIAPSLGQVEKVWTAPSSKDPSRLALVADVTIGDALQGAVEKNWYPTCSVGAPKRAEDGKRYLQHLKMCGAEPGAVKGLETFFQNVMKDVVNLSDSDAGNVFDDEFIKLEDSPGDPGKEEKVTPEELQKALDAETAKVTALEKQVSDLNASAKIATEEAAKYKDQLAKIKQQYPEAAIELSDSDPRIKSLMDQIHKDRKASLMKAAEGKVPKGMEKELIALADSLSIADTIELSDAAGKKEKKSAFDLITGIFEKLPEPVVRGELLLSDHVDPGKEKVSVSEIMKHV